MRALVVEDEEDLTQALARARIRLVLDVASTGGEAVELARLATYDVVALDRRLSDGDGLGVIPRLRGLRADVRVLALTALDGVEGHIEGLDAGAGDYLRVTCASLNEAAHELGAEVFVNALDADVSRLRARLREMDVNEYLDFAVPAYQGQPVTLRRLMTHTVGLAETARLLIGGDFSGVRPLEKYLRASLPPRVMAPGRTPAHSDYGAAGRAPRGAGLGPELRRPSRGGGDGAARHDALDLPPTPARGPPAADGQGP